MILNNSLIDIYVRNLHYLPLQIFSIFGPFRRFQLKKFPCHLTMVAKIL